MFTGATKIVKPEGQEADEFEQQVAQELFNLEVREGRDGPLWYICSPATAFLAWDVYTLELAIAAGWLLLL